MSIRQYVLHLIELIKRLSSYFILVPNEKNLEDSFYQLLFERNYDEALKLALQHRYLDIDLVYKCKWRHSGITVQLIDNVLGNIQDKLWAINECVKTVPMSYEACRRLLEFGLEEANVTLMYELGADTRHANSDVKSSGRAKVGRQIKEEEKQQLLGSHGEHNDNDELLEMIDFSQLNSQQRELCRCRQSLIHFEHSLSAYEKTLGDYSAIQQNFDHVFYDEFRRKSPLNFCIDFANEGHAYAVEICLDYYLSDLRRHLLPILSNFPETLSPYQYRNLLPCIRDNEKVFEWRSLSGSKPLQDKSDWSCRDRTIIADLQWKEKKELYEKEFYDNNPQLRKFLAPLTSELLTEWYIERALDMENRTLLSACAIQLLFLGSDLRIKNLKQLHDDLIEFDRIVYDCCADKDIYLSYQDFKKLQEIDKLILITGDSLKGCTDRFRFYVLPYLHRRDDKMTLQVKTDVLRGYFRRLANTREQICRSIYNDLLDRLECDNFVAEWTKGMDDALDEIGEEIKKIERDREANQLSLVANQTFALGDYNECHEACQLIMRKDFREHWAICCQLGMTQKFHDNEAKYKLLAFALAHCDDPDGRASTKILDNIIELRKRDQKIQLAYLKRNM